MIYNNTIIFIHINYINYIDYIIQIEIIDIIAIIDIIIVPRSPLCLQLQWLSLHIAGPAQCPRVDKPHPASVPRPLPAVAGRSLEMIAQAVQYCSCVTDRNNGQFSQDTIDWDDVKNWFLVV